MRSIPASEFKAHCLSYMKLTHDKREVFLITKHGKPMAKLVPVEQEGDTEILRVFDKLNQYTVIKGNVIDPIDVDWDVLNDD